MTKPPSYKELCISVQEQLKRINGLEALVKQNQKLARENTLLKERLSKYENPKKTQRIKIMLARI